MRSLLSAALIGLGMLLAGCIDNGAYYDGRPRRYDHGFHQHRDYGDRRFDPRLRDGWRHGRRDWVRRDDAQSTYRDVPRDRYGRPI